MHLFGKGELEFNQSLFKYLIFKSVKNGIGEYGVRQLSQCHWHKLNILS